MGLFSAFILGFGAMALFALAYVAARFFQPTPVAARIAVVFVLGSVVGAAATVLVSSCINGSTNKIDAFAFTARRKPQP